MVNVFADNEKRGLASEIGTLWQSACGGEAMQEHEAPWVLASLSDAQCDALVNEHAALNKSELGELCDRRRR